MMSIFKPIKHTSDVMPAMPAMSVSLASQPSHQQSQQFSFTADIRLFRRYKCKAFVIRLKHNIQKHIHWISMHNPSEDRAEQSGHILSFDAASRRRPITIILRDFSCFVMVEEIFKNQRTVKIGLQCLYYAK